MKREETGQRRGRGKREAARLNEKEWLFGEEQVPESELVACCCWEYARESRTMKELRQRCADACQADGRSSDRADSLVYEVAGTIKHPVPSVEVFLREAALLAPWKNSFPKAWRSLTKAERLSWSQRLDLTELKAARHCFPAQRGSLLDVHSVVRTIEAHRTVAANPQIDELAADTVALSCQPISEAPFDWTEQSGRLPGGFLCQDGTEVSVMEIAWADFTNKEIAEAIATMRPGVIPEPKDTGGHKRGDWRAKLQRLGSLRLIGWYGNVEKAIDRLVSVVPPEQRKKTKFCEPAEFKRDAGIAVADFHNLLPFVNSAEKPLASL
jgi:hypothetical protein